ncbi:MAG: hypothetical protein ACSLFQ_01165 [Thermoanaerobaculia bacterium]
MRRFAIAIGIVAAVAVAPALLAQGPGCGHGAGKGQGQGKQHGKRMHANDPDHAADRDMIHFLIDNRETITRKVTKIDAGVDTLTESSDPEVARQIRGHVASMKSRVAEATPIHQRDPFFVEIFKHADKIEMVIEPTENGVRVRETSKDPYVVKLIQSHAEVIDKFLENGRTEMHADHPLPGK